jgi:hypothetical protein
MSLPFPFRRERQLLDLLVSTEQGSGQSDADR